MKLFILIACTCIYTATAETVRFIQQPTTDKQCYEDGDNGTLTLSFNVTGTTRLDNYIVALAVLKEDGTWVFKSNGTELNFHDGTNRDIEHDRYRVTMSYVGRTVGYRLDITVLKFLDETSGLYAFIIESHSGNPMKKSSVNATFHFGPACPQRLQPTMSSVTNKDKGDSNQDRTTDPTEPSTATAPPNDDSTSTGYIPAKRIIGIPEQIPIYILMVICLCTLAICCKIHHSLRKSQPLRIEHLEMGEQNRSKKPSAQI